MLAQATLRIDLAAISHNTRTLVSALAPIEVVGVTKVTCADPHVARAMIAGGVSALADSRLENLARLREEDLDVPLWLLRAPTPGLANATVALADISLQSDPDTLVALDAAADRLGKLHGIVLMVDVGDLREGVTPQALPELLAHVIHLPHLVLVGLGTSLTCYGGVVPSTENLGLLAELAREAERRVDHELRVSGGMSSSVELALSGDMPPGIRNLRIGESIMLGVSTVTREPLPGLRTDALTVLAPVIECASKPSLPSGRIVEDAFGGMPQFEDRGERLRAIVALGKQDVPPEGLTPLDDGVEILGASSDHLVLDVEEMEVRPKAGDALRFRPNYAATLRLFTSPYVLKSHQNG